MKLEVLEDRRLLSAMLLKDINPSGDASPQDFTNVNGVIFFTADDGTNGRQLWKTDGTAAGTVLVKAINPGPGADPMDLTNVNGTLFFDATDGTNGRELWKSDGTAAGTVMVKAIYPGHGSDPGNLTNVNGTLFFDADDGVHGDELWKSDGTAAGTVLVKDIYPGSGSSNLYELTNVNGTLFFAANDGTNGIELWKSDGTAAGTALVKDIFPGSGSSYPAGLTAVGGTLFFAAEDGISGYELWKSDGAAAGTALVKDIFPGPDDSNPDKLTNVSGTLFFQADDGTHGLELWKSDGTTAGTVLVKDIYPGLADSNPDWLTNVNGTLFFSADDGTHGVELWESDGTSAGTFLVQQINSSGAGSNPTDLAYANGTLYFAADDGVDGIQPWVLVQSPVVTHFSVSGPASSTAGASFSVTVTALDQFNNVFTGYAGTVHFTSSDPQAGLPADYTFTTADNGVHTFSGGVTLKTAGAQAVTATDIANGSITGTAPVTVAPAAASTLVVAGFPSPVTAGVAGSVTVTAKDPYGNVATGYAGTVHFTSSDPQAALPADYTFVAADNGMHSFSATLKTAGTQSLTATDTATDGITGTQAGITVNPAAASQFLVATDAASPDVAGTVFDVAVAAVDPYGNIDTNYRGTVHFTSGDPYGATLPADYTFQVSDQGQVVLSGMTALYTAGTWDVTATDAGNGSITGSAFVTVVAAPAVNLLVVAPPFATSGTPFDVTVVAQDPYGNTDTNYQGTITWTTTDPDPGVVLPADYAFQPSDQGRVTFPGGVTLITPGVQALTVTDTVNTAITGSTTVTVNPPASAPDRNHGPKPGTGIPSPTAWPSLVVVQAPLIEATPVEAPPTRNATQLDRFFVSAEADGQSLASPNLRHKALAQADEGFWILFWNDSRLSIAGFPTRPWDYYPAM